MTQANKLQGGEKWSRHSYGFVRFYDPVADVIYLTNEKGLEWHISPDIFEQEFVVANQFETTEAVTRTELIDKIVSSSRICMEVHFRKKPDQKNLISYVTDLLDGKVTRPKPRALAAALKEINAGERRTMIGRHYGTFDEFGRLQFTDMETNGLRLIDPRTVEWAIIDNVKYELK